jgi:hypothetical protein
VFVGRKFYTTIKYNKNRIIIEVRNRVGSKIFKLGIGLEAEFSRLGKWLEV